jgi:cytidyltransferase-like protein
MTTPKDEETPEGRLAIFPGSFDPLTNGHVDIILRSTHLFEQIVVAVLVNAEKQPLFTPDERIAIIKDVFKEYPNIEVETFDGLLVEYAQPPRASAIVRGIGGVRLRVRVPDGVDEPASRADARNGVHDAGRAVHLPEFETHQGGVQSGRRRPRTGAIGRRAVDEPQEPPAGVRWTLEITKRR